MCCVGCQGLRPQQIYHVAVMPCFDKKLEASRSDFHMSNAETREVDCVITSGMVCTTMFFVCMYAEYVKHLSHFWVYIGEVLKMLEEENVSLHDVKPAPLDTM